MNWVSCTKYWGIALLSLAIPMLVWAQAVPPAQVAPTTNLPVAKSAPTSNLPAPKAAPNPLVIPIAAAYLTASQTFISRGTVAAYFDSSGVLQTAGAHVARHDYDMITHADKGILVEPRRTNFVRNSILSGAVIGNTQSGGKMPTNWFVRGASLATVYGISVTIVGIGIEDGLNYVDIQFKGIPVRSTDYSAGYYFESSKVIPARVGQVWTVSAYEKIVAGSLNNINTFSMSVNGRDSDGASGQNRTTDLMSMTNTLKRYTTSIMFTSTDTRFVTGSAFAFGLTVGMPIDVTIRVAGIQLELGGGATSYIPTAGSAVIRGQDIYQYFNQ